MKPKTPEEINIMREGGRRLADLLQNTASQAIPGRSTKFLADFVRKELKKLQLTSATLGFEGYNEVICTSLNDHIVHGVPSTKQVLSEGDLLGIDITVKYKGLVVDSAVTVFVGDKKNISPDIKRLLEGSEQALNAGIAAVRGSGTRVGDISGAIQSVLDKHRLGIVRDLVGHGVGYDIHEEPNIPNYGVAGTGPTLKAGMTICIEPMATLGDWKVKVLPDKWTVATVDGSLSAHFEHTVLVTEDGAEVLTL